MILTKYKIWSSSKSLKPPWHSKVLLLQTMIKQDVKLFGVWSSLFCHRVIWALKAKKIEYYYVEEDLANKSPLLLQYNPIHQKVPVLVHNDKPIVESIVILQYIDETWKQYPTFPSDPHEKAMALIWAKFGDEKLVASVWSTFVTEGKEKEEAIAAALVNLKIVEDLLKENRFFGGAKIGFLDFCLGWICNLVPVIDEINGSKMVDKQTFPLLSAWMDNFSSSEITHGTWPSNELLATRLRYVRSTVL